MSNSTAGDLVTDLLREKILTGEIPDNTKLTQTWIAEQLGVSRMPIREALSKLTFEGYMERLDNRHTRVIGSGHEVLQSRIRFFVMLESEAAARVPETGEQLSRMADLLNSFEKSGNPQDELAFHDLLFQASEDRFYNQMYRKIILPTLKVLIKTRRGDRAVAFDSLHQLVINLQKGEGDKTASSLESYYLEFI
ncbi:MAG: GntR family transcriptional regulator [Spirochaetales bacterium]|nr:GntR family transcriptional regulator [Spirochaetales bacterium]